MSWEEVLLGETPDFNSEGTKKKATSRPAGWVTEKGEGSLRVRVSRRIKIFLPVLSNVSFNFFFKKHFAKIIQHSPTLTT